MNFFHTSLFHLWRPKWCRRYSLLIFHDVHRFESASLDQMVKHVRFELCFIFNGIHREKFKEYSNWHFYFMFEFYFFFTFKSHLPSLLNSCILYSIWNSLSFTWNSSLSFVSFYCILFENYLSLSLF